MSDLGLIIVVLAIATGIVGIVVPRFPGALLALSILIELTAAVLSAATWMAVVIS